MHMQSFARNVFAGEIRPAYSTLLPHVSDFEDHLRHTRRSKMVGIGLLLLSGINLISCKKKGKMARSEEADLKGKEDKRMRTYLVHKTCKNEPLCVTEKEDE